MATSAENLTDWLWLSACAADAAFSASQLHVFARKGGGYPYGLPHIGHAPGALAVHALLVDGFEASVLCGASFRISDRYVEERGGLGDHLPGLPRDTYFVCVS